jgi:hypothetical protein
MSEAQEASLVYGCLEDTARIRMDKFLVSVKSMALGEAQIEAQRPDLTSACPA